jgi:hypothetical protein
MSDSILSITSIYKDSQKGVKRKLDIDNLEITNDDKLLADSIIDFILNSNSDSTINSNSDSDSNSDSTINSILDMNISNTNNQHINLNPFKKISLDKKNTFLNDLFINSPNTTKLIINPSVNIQTVENVNLTKIIDKFKETTNNIESIPIIKTEELSPEAIHEELFKKKMLCIFRVLVYKNFDFSKDNFDINNGTILYKQIPKVCIHINYNEVAEDIILYFTLLEKYTTLHNNNSALAHKIVMTLLEKEKKIVKEINITIGHPFFIVVKINNKAQYQYYRKNPYSNLTLDQSIDKIINNLANTSLNYIDLIMTTNLISKLTKGIFQDGNDFLSSLIHCIDKYKRFNNNIIYNQKIIDFRGFYKLHKKIEIEYAKIPIK